MYKHIKGILKEVKPLGLIILPEGPWTNKSSRTICEKSPFEWLVKILQVTLKTIQVIDIAFRCLKEFESRSLLIKRLHTWDTHTHMCEYNNNNQRRRGF